MNYNIWKDENGFEPSQLVGGSLLEVIISGLLFLGVIYLVFGILAVHLLAIDKFLRIIFPDWFVDAVPEFIVSFIFTGGFPPFLIFGLASNEDFGIGFVLGGLTAWLGWLLILTYFYPWNMFILLSIIIFVVVVVYLFNKIVP